MLFWTNRSHDMACCSIILLMRFNFTQAWISNHIPSKVWDEITYSVTNFNVEVLEWISKFIPNSLWMSLLIHEGLMLIHVHKGVPNSTKLFYNQNPLSRWLMHGVVNIEEFIFFTTRRHWKCTSFIFYWRTHVLDMVIIMLFVAWLNNEPGHLLALASV